MIPSRMSYRIDESAGIVELHGPDGLRPEEVEAALRQVLEDPRYHPALGFLRDRRGFRMPPTGFVRGLAWTIRHTAGLIGSRFAFVVSDPGNYGMVRMLSMMSDVADIRAFTDPAEAREWLTGGDGPSDLPA
jgi:hypothetical protein